MEPSPTGTASTQAGALQQHLEAVLGLQELVDVANGLLPSYLPKDVSGRAADDVNPRLVRFYTTEGLVPEPHKEGREARYVYDHLLALLLVRKLLAEGFGSAAIRKALAGRQRAELEALLQDEVRVELAPNQPQQAEGSPPTVGTALAKAEFLKQVRSRAGLGHVVEATTAATGGPDPAAQRRRSSRGAGVQRPPQQGADAPASAYRTSPVGVESTWIRMSIHEGLELAVRDDFTWPVNHVAEEQLLQQMRVALLQLEQARKRRGS